RTYPFLYGVVSLRSSAFDHRRVCQTRLAEEDCELQDAGGLRIGTPRPVTPGSLETSYDRVLLNTPCARTTTKWRRGEVLTCRTVTRVDSQLWSALPTLWNEPAGEWARSTGVPMGRRHSGARRRLAWFLATAWFASGSVSKRPVSSARSKLAGTEPQPVLARS